MMPEQDIDKLIALYLEDELSHEQAELFSAWLTEDPAHAQYVAKLGLVERGLNRHFLSQQSSDLFSQLAELEAHAETAGPVDITDRIKRETFQKKLALRQREQARAAALGAAGGGTDADGIVLPKAAVFLAFAAMLGLVAWLGWPDPPAAPTDNYRSAATPTGTDDQPSRLAYVARVRSSVEARWSGLDNAHRAFLAADTPVTLAEGYAQVVFDDGAVVIVQAPATFEPTGGNAMRLISGRITAQVPDAAHGFTVATAGGLITDYGTEFGVSVESDGRVRAQTFTGRVTLTPTDGSDGLDEAAVIDMPAGVAVQADRTGRVDHVAMDQAAYVRQAEYDARQNAEASPYDRWLAHSYTLRRDPAMLAYYTFDNRAEAPDLLLNRAGRTAGRFDGLLGINHDAMTSPRWTEGRFPQKQGLSFGVIGGGMARAVQVDGLGGRDLGDALTVAVWLRVPPGEDTAGGGTLLSLRDAPTRHMSFQFSLFLRNDPYANTLQFGAGNELAVDHPNDNFRYAQHGGIGGDAWVLAVAVYDAGQATFYLNGYAVGVDETVGPLALTRPDAPLLIGTDPTTTNAQGERWVEAFMGDIDEVAILERAMSAEEIRAMYRAGQPGPAAD